MDSLIQIFSANKLIVAAANIFGIIGGIFLLWKLFSTFYKFSLDIYSNNISKAIYRYRKKMLKTSIYCANDIHYFTSYLFNRSLLIILTTIGVLIGVIYDSSNSVANLQDRFSKQSFFSDFETFTKFSDVTMKMNMLVFLILFAFNLFRSQVVALEVRRLRRRWRKRGRMA
jgi:hypothetical protein